MSGVGDDRLDNDLIEKALLLRFRHILGHDGLLEFFPIALVIQNLFHIEPPYSLMLRT